MKGGGSLDYFTGREGCWADSNMLRLYDFSVIRRLETSSTGNKEKEKGPWNASWQIRAGCKGEFPVTAGAGARLVPGRDLGCSCREADGLDALLWALTGPNHHFQFPNIRYENKLNC